MGRSSEDEESNGGQVALFANNLGKDRDEIYGATLSVRATDFFSYTIAGIYNDDWEIGVGATLSLNENLNAQVEYNSATEEIVYGVGLKYKALFGEVRYLDDDEEFIAMAGIQFDLF